MPAVVWNVDTVIPFSKDLLGTCNRTWITPMIIHTMLLDKSIGSTSASKQPCFIKSQTTYELDRRNHHGFSTY